MSTPSINPVKSKYKVRNWKEYNKNLCKRGSLTLFIESEVLHQWKLLINKKKEVGEAIYPDNIIACCLLIKANYRLAYCQSVGFLKSLFALIGKGDYPVPDYSTLCRRKGRSKHCTWRKR